MDIRDLIENKRCKLEFNKHDRYKRGFVNVNESDMSYIDYDIKSYNEQSISAMGELYVDTLLLEEFIIDGTLDIVSEGIGDKLSEVKDRAISFIKRLWARLKEWFGKLIHNLQILVTPASKLASKYGKELMQLYQKYCRTMMVNAPIYGYDPNLMFKSGKKLVVRYLKVLAYIEKGILTNDKYDPIACQIGNKLGKVLVDENGKVNTDNCREYGKLHIILEDKVEQRKLSEALDIQSFKYALESKSDIKGFRTLMKETDDMFKDSIRILESSFDDKDEKVAKISKECAFWTGNYSKMMTAILNSYLSELKKLYRFTMALVKQLLRKGGKSFGADDKSTQNENTNQQRPNQSENNNEQTTKKRSDRVVLKRKDNTENQ